MKASEIMTRNPGTVLPSQSVADAVKIMRSEECGIVPVLASDNSETIIGVLTDRDIALNACGDGGKGPSTEVSAVMTKNLFCVHPDDDLGNVREVMRNAGVRRVPVVEKNDHLIGIISLKDLADNIGNSDLGKTEESILAQPPNSRA